MRTTVDLDEDILRTVKDLAREREQSLGRVLSDLIRQGLQPAYQVKVKPGVIPTLPLIPGGRSVTDQIIKDMLEDEI